MNIILARFTKHSSRLYAPTRIIKNVRMYVTCALSDENICVTIEILISTLSNRLLVRYIVSPRFFFSPINGWMGWNRKSRTTLNSCKYLLH